MPKKTAESKRRWRLSWWLRHKRERCDCGGYWFPHRRGGGRCYSNPRWPELYGDGDLTREAFTGDQP